MNSFVVRRDLVEGWQLGVKRGLDIGVVLIGGLLALPLLVVIAALIWLDSPGGVFYAQTRVGKRGREIRVWKFRTMVEDAEAVLQNYLADHPAARKEWEESHKLKHDPRVTRVGRVLRKLSLDELPQLWNVLKGEMSLVGPRPILKEEVGHYRDGYELYTRVRPGMTGLWQVSGRGDTDYGERVRYVEYYVRNWSIWLDLSILLRTPLAVLRRDGAY